MDHTCLHTTHTSISLHQSLPFSDSLSRHLPSIIQYSIPFSTEHSIYILCRTFQMYFIPFLFCSILFHLSSLLDSISHSSDLILSYFDILTNLSFIHSHSLLDAAEHLRANLTHTTDFGGVLQLCTLSVWQQHSLDHGVTPHAWREQPPALPHPARAKTVPVHDATKRYTAMNIQCSCCNRCRLHYLARWATILHTC